MDIASEFHTKLLSRKRSAEEYRVYRAGLEWDLTDPIVIDGPEDFKSTQGWRDRLTPYRHQVSNLVTFCRRLPVTLLADDVGLGKTISAGLIVSELKARSRLSRILIVCPKILAQQWKEELEAKFDILAQIAIGKELLEEPAEETIAIITTYNSARLYLERIPEDRFQMLILDEAHKLRNLYGTKKPPEVAKQFRKALDARRFRFVLMLTATPIQNRLWDLYSLVDLLTVARGHDNPFGSPGMFARRFIADDREDARELKHEAREEFRSIVYGYMSRVRRGDAQLYFPDRKVLMHKVDPTSAELELIKTIAKPIQKLNKLTQISILQALTSSPEALMAQLLNMARKGTVPADLAAAVKSIVTTMPPTAKLLGLGGLIEKLKKESPADWRLVIFTIRRETQTTIQNFLEQKGLTVGIINGDSGERNQETINRFRADPPSCRVIVSTEAGSEGVNLQVANVLVNYDLPWNPMIVEQRIGRVQRLASNHAYVSIYNVTLRGTFEEYIVGRLMEKLQMAAHAIGDVEALLHGSDIGEGDDDNGEGFEEQILKLVLAALAGKDTDKATRLAEKSIEDAKAELEREEAAISEMLGSMDGSEYVGPRSPSLPPTPHTMGAEEFTLKALDVVGVRLTPHPAGLFLAEENAGREYIRFQEQTTANLKSTFYGPGAPAFQRLVSRLVASGVHDVEDLDIDPAKACDDTASAWAETFGGTKTSTEIGRITRVFNGTAVIRVRATVAHDSYERLVDVACLHEDAYTSRGRPALAPLPRSFENPNELGLLIEKLQTAASGDEHISEFCRFYLERREQETKSSKDERKRKKLQDEFTPRLEMMLVGLEGKLHRKIEVKTSYRFNSGPDYESEITITPHNKVVAGAPQLALCSKSGKTVPNSCISKCDVTGAEVLSHLLERSEVSGRMALPEFMVTCGVTNKRILADEAEKSAISGQFVRSDLLKVSALSGVKAEPEHFEVCNFTKDYVLRDEIAKSEISGQNYRVDQKKISAVSGRSGHSTEFVVCHETRQPITHDESEKCEVTGYAVRLGVLERCEVTGKKVLPIGLGRCDITSKRALKRFLVNSSISQCRVLEEIAVRSAASKFCAPSEAKICVWSERKTHPDDIRDCQLTGLPIHVEYIDEAGQPRLRPLAEILDGVRRNAEEAHVWSNVSERVANAIGGGKCIIEAAVRSPSGRHLAACSQVKTMMGLRVHHVGAIFELSTNSIVGRVSSGKRSRNKWIEVER
ncbi:DEAD/DEAH box helicase [Tardiphaga sp. 20_F10_N6_6]|jgi:superfamily II DNA or RNA helicase|uniref:DEAD/DEAH box helicase n=1 Tax=unclassified Tardiphaga TaxID=2631404 RepID=UPI003F1EC697